MAPKSIGVKRCPHGRGIFAKRNIEKGEILFQFTGKVVPFNFEFDPMIEGNYFQFDADVYLDVEPPGRYACHSCDPNSGLVDSVTLAAIRPIPKGQEILFDYSTCMGEKSWTLECMCGSTNCRGIILDFDELDPALQKMYLDLGIVPGWLLSKRRNQ